MNEPLAERLRPKKLEDYISQSHLVGNEGVLTQHIKKGLIPSLTVSSMLRGSSRPKSSTAR